MQTLLSFSPSLSLPPSLPPSLNLTQTNLRRRRPEYCFSKRGSNYEELSSNNQLKSSQEKRPSMQNFADISFAKIVKYEFLHSCCLRSSGCFSNYLIVNFCSEALPWPNPWVILLGNTGVAAGAQKPSGLRHCC